MAALNDGRRRLRPGLLAVAVATVVVLTGCKKPAEAKTEPEAAPAVTPTPVVASTPAAPTPGPVAVAKSTPKPVATPGPELAPPGVYFLLTTVSIETSDGIMGLKPGQMLKQARPGVYLADTVEVKLRPDQVTNDLTVARRIAVQDQKIQAALRQRLGGQPPPAQPNPLTGGVPAAPGGPTVPAAPVASTRPADANKTLRDDLYKQRDANLQQFDQVTAALSKAAAHWGGNFEYAAKHSPACGQLYQQYNSLRAEKDAIDAKISALR